MGANRLNRDQILLEALDMVDSPALDAHDRPDGTISPSAFSLMWLQRGLDLFYSKWPFGATLASTALSFTTGVATYTLPATFILDYQDGVVLADNKGRLVKRGLGYILTQNADLRQKPRVYTVVGGQLRVWPAPDQAYSATLWYYPMPAELDPNDVPTFPADWALVEYVRLRGKEWLGSLQPGQSLSYINSVIADLQRSGLGNEAESDQIPLDPQYFGYQAQGLNDWMGSTTI